MNKKEHAKLLKVQRLRKTGLPPGTITHTGKPTTEEVEIRVFEFNDQFFTESLITNISALEESKSRNTIKWIDVNGIHNTKIIEELGTLFNIHPLTQEDIASVEGRPKFEEYATYFVAICKMIYYEENQVNSEQLCIILLENIVITFQEVHGKDAFEPIRDRIRQAKGRVRKAGADYLAYALLDAVVDNYFLIIERLGDRIEVLEERMLTEENDKYLMHDLHKLKREMIMLRKSVWPMRELIVNMQRSEHHLFSPGTLIYVRDVYDHTVRIIETIETYRDLLAGMLDVHISTNSNRMNEVMKVLTIISSLFIPVTFIVGVYGMNFQYMPELTSKWGYPTVWIIMVVLIAGMLFYFKKRRWL